MGLTVVDRLEERAVGSLVAVVVRVDFGVVVEGYLKKVVEELKSSCLLVLTHPPLQVGGLTVSFEVCGKAAFKAIGFCLWVNAAFGWELKTHPPSDEVTDEHRGCCLCHIKPHMCPKMWVVDCILSRQTAATFGMA